jgi:hypothetical protein
LIRSYLLILLLFLTIQIFPQQFSLKGKQIFIAKNYTEFGEPIGTVNDKKLELEQTYSIILNSNKNKFKEHLVFLYIEKTGGGDSYDTFYKLIRTDKEKNFVAFNYFFTSEGTYEIYFTDFTKNKIASTTVTVGKKEERKPERAAVGQLRPSLGITFCKQVIGDVPVSEVKSVSINKDGGEVYIFVFDEKPLDIEKLVVSFWRKKNKLDQDGQFIDSKKYIVNGNWHDTFFKYRFQNTGDYKINFYNGNEILLKTAYITVEK